MTTAFALLRNQDDPVPPLVCEFNPSTVRLSKSARWHTPRNRHARTQPRPQFGGTGPQQLTINLLFNAYDRTGAKRSKIPVSQAVDTLLSWTNPSQKSQSGGDSLPPTVTFQWGAALVVTGFLKSVIVDYLLFDTDGMPLRATANVTIQTVPPDVKPTNPTSGGIAGRRGAQTSEADSLASIAQREYGDPGLWRAIAIANDIDDPGRIPPGTRLLLPPRAQAVALAAVGGDPR